MREFFLVYDLPSFWWMNIILAIAIIYMNRYRPARSTTLWLMIMALFPIVGFIPYLLLGRDTRRRRKFYEKNTMDMRIMEQALVDFDDIRRKQELDDAGRFQDYMELVAINARTGRTELSEGNRVQIFTDGRSKFDALIADIDAATQEINLQYYILKSDALGYELIHALMRAVSRGVHVRVLSDGIGVRSLSRRAQKEMRQSGIEFGIFFPSVLRYINLRLNYRNHRKIVVIDNAIGYIGGFNVGDEYVGRSPRFGPWRDTHLRIEGLAVASMKLRFLQDWYYVLGTDPAQEPAFTPRRPENGDVFCQLVSSGPDTALANIKFSMLKMISAANKAIYIQTPYFIPDQSIYEALVLAIQQGVEVNLMIPDRPDHPVVYPATMSFAGELIHAGAKVYRYERGFLHSKVLIIDDVASLVGSCNMDERSFSLNFESSEFLLSPEVNAQLRAAFQKDIEFSTLLTPELYQQRSLLMKLKEPVCRLFAPLL